MRQPREPLQPGTRIQTCAKLILAQVGDMKPRYPNTRGRINYALAGFHNALYNVIHDDGTSAIYLIDELEFEPPVEQGKMSAPVEIKEPWRAMKGLAMTKPTEDEVKGLSWLMSVAAEHAVKWGWTKDHWTRLAAYWWAVANREDYQDPITGEVKEVP